MEESNINGEAYTMAFVVNGTTLDYKGIENFIRNKCSPAKIIFQKIASVKLAIIRFDEMDRWETIEKHNAFLKEQLDLLTRTLNILKNNSAILKMTVQKEEEKQE